MLSASLLRIYRFNKRYINNYIKYNVSNVTHKNTNNKCPNNTTHISHSTPSKKSKVFISGTLKYDIHNETDYLTIQSIKHSYDNTIEYDIVNKRFYIEY
jgi:hypothetical protein